MSIDILLIDIYCHFKYSAKSWTEYMEIQTEFEDIKPLKFLKHSTTRWLSLECCVKRLIEKWPALYAYFDRETSSGTNIERAEKIATQLKDPLVKLLCHFIAFALKPLNKFSTAFQTCASRIGSLQSDVRGLLRSYMCNFIKPDVFNDVDDITTLDYLDPENQATNDELGIGTTTQLLLCGDLEDEVVGTSIERRFYKYVRSFYEASVSKILNKFPFKDDTIRELSFLDPRYRTKCTVNGIMHLSTRFTSFSTDEIDTLITEFQEYRIASDQQFPTFNYKECAAVDHFWAAMAEVRCLEKFQYSLLS